MNKTEIITEASVDIFDGISDEQLNIRKIALARVLDEAEHALDAAERAGKDELADKLRERVDTLRELFDRAEERTPPPADGKGDGGEVHDKSTKDGKKETDSEDKADKGSDGDDEEDDWETTEVKDSGDSKTTDRDKSSGKDRGKEKYKSSVTGSTSDGSGDSDGDGEESDTESDKKSEHKRESGDINPFEQRMRKGKADGDKMYTHEEIFNAAKKILSKLGGEAKRGASAGIKDLLSSHRYLENLSKPLTEAITKTLAQMSEDEFNDELAKTMELVDQILDIDYSDDLEARVTEFKRKTSSALDRMELEKEDAAHTKASKSALRAREVSKYEVGKKLAGLDSFKASLYRAMRDQVIESEEEEETWAVINRRHEDDPTILKKGSRMEDTYDDEGIPTINVYFDQSGSWRDPEITIGEQAINVLKEFHNNEEIKLNKFFISAGGVFTTASAARAFPSAEGWAACLKHIRESGVKNVVILSDSDLDYFEYSNRPTGNNGKTVVSGCVWWLWKNGDVSRKALKELIGKRGNYQYSFTTSRT